MVKSAEKRNRIRIRDPGKYSRRPQTTDRNSENELISVRCKIAWPQAIGEFLSVIQFSGAGIMDLFAACYLKICFAVCMMGVELASNWPLGRAQVQMQEVCTSEFSSAHTHMHMNVYRRPGAVQKPLVVVSAFARFFFDDPGLFVIWYLVPPAAVAVAIGAYPRLPG